MSSNHNNPQAGLAGPEFSRVFPFYLKIDKDFQILEAGPGWKKFHPVNGGQFFEHFEILKPKLIEPDLGALLEKEDEPFILALKKTKLQFRCELLPRQKEALLIMSAEADSLEAFKDVGLSFKDFAIHDPSADLIRTVQNQAGHLDTARELTRKLKESRAQLVIAKEAAEEATEEAVRVVATKQQFLAAMSHELRTPMGGVLGMAELLQDTALDCEQERLLGCLTSSGDSLLAIINDILDYSKIEIGALELEPRDFDPRAMLEEVADMLALSAHGKGLEFAAWCEPSVPQKINGDETRLKQILINLVNNAIKFTSAGQVTIRLSYDGEFLRGSVQDTGIGITPSAMPGLFDPFIQTASARTQEFGGTGLGLTITKQLCEAMGGEVQCKSVVGTGTIFDFQARVASVVSYEPNALEWNGPVAVVGPDGLTRRSWMMALDELNAHVYTVDTLDELPDEAWHAVLIPMGSELPRGVPLELVYVVCNVTDASEASRSSSELGGYLTSPCKPSRLRREWGSAEDESDGAGSVHLPPLGMRVLLVEDDQVNQAVAAAFLQKMGAAYAVASNGREALDTLEDQEFDLILMDCQMPIMDGYTATQLIRKKYGEGTTIVAMIANAMPSERAQCTKAGMNDFLSMPTTYQALAAKLASWYRAPGQRQAS